MIASLLFLAAVQSEIPVSARIVEISGSPHVMHDPEFVGAGITNLRRDEQVRWSPDESKLWFRGIRPKPNPLEPPTSASKEFVGIWSATTRKVTGEYTAPAGYGISTVMWEGAGGSAVVILGHPDLGTNAKLLRMMPDGRTSEIRTPTGPGVHWTASTSSEEAGILFVAQQIQLQERAPETRFYFVPAGQVEAVEVPSPAEVSSHPFIDERFQLSVSLRGKARQLYKFNSATRTFVPSTGKFGYEEIEPTVSLVSGDGLAALRDERKRVASFGSWWVTSDPKAKYSAALLAPKAEKADLAVRSLNAWYVDSGNLFVRRLKKITQDQVDDLLECEERILLLSDVKQVGTAIMIYMADSDDMFPPTAGFREKIYPYTRSNQLLDGFIYSYRGPQEATKLEKPSETEMGYKEGQFGRAVVRADSSARWESRRKTPNKSGC